MSSTKRRLDLRALGAWSKKVRIELADGYDEVLLCTLGDRSEVIERGHEAMQQKLLEYRAGGERRAALREAMLLSPASDLAEMAADGERAELLRRLERQQPEPVAPRRDLAAAETEQAFAQRLADHEARCQALAEARARSLEEAVEKRRAELVLLPKEELVELALPRRLDLECWQIFCRACDDWALFRAVRQADDSSLPYFDKIQEVRGLHPSVKEQLKRAYLELDAGAEAGADLATGDSLPNFSSSSPSSD